jgi:hypothetical protein
MIGNLINAVRGIGKNCPVHLPAQFHAGLKSLAGFVFFVYLKAI